MFSNIPVYLLCMRATFALQIPRYATVSYTNSSASVHPPTSTTPGSFCCEVYAPGVALHHWYSGGVQKVPDEVIVTEFLHYNSTFMIRNPNSDRSLQYRS
jgi:hypothetical protein